MAKEIMWANLFIMNQQLQTNFKQLISQPKKVVSDYKDPKDIEVDLIPELMEAYRLDYKRFVEEFGYSGSFRYLRDEIDLKRRKFKKGGLSNIN